MDVDDRTGGARDLDGIAVDVGAAGEKMEPWKYSRQILDWRDD